VRACVRARARARRVRIEVAEPWLTSVASEADLNLLIDLRDGVVHAGLDEVS
jgi:hypothetical protein